MLTIKGKIDDYSQHFSRHLRVTSSGGHKNPVTDLTGLWSLREIGLGND